MRTESWFLACVLIPCSMAAADDIGPFGFEGRWGNEGTNCVSDAEQVPTQITSTTIGFDEDHCTLTSVEPLGDPATSWIVETECESEGSFRDVTFLLGVVEVDGERKLTLTNMRTGSSGMFEDCDALDFSSSAAADHTDMPTIANVPVENSVGEPDSTGIFGPETVLSEDLNWIDGWLPVYWVYPEECATSAECLRLSGASESAVFFAETYAELYDVDKRDGIWLTDLVEAGTIDVGKIPILQTEEYAFVLLNGVPSILSVNREFLFSEDKDRLLQMDQHFAVLHRRFPELSVWGTYNDWIGARPAPGGGQRFIFRFSLNNGCRLCENAGWIYVAYDFDRSGNYLGPESLGLAEVNGPPPPEVMIWLQESFNELGYYSGPIDGSLGRQTRAAIEAFMRDHGIVRPAGSWSREDDPSGQPFGELDLAIAAALGDLTSAPTLSDQHPN